ncbi:GyrI-like domain-containing protein [Spirosoma fluviale]|uniref:Effector-binding domain-containing protein n=1 Tax=Spirosoma fluviale TaxID=1597977 RepID=A0A286FYV9_9BACT|nr:GyrI-like domain-containing protein [Spirosoma fluviale]SOD88119.1 effector-binding domain-containing protein [Spirosoma fluviale]
MTTELTSPANALQVKETQPFTALCFTTHATLLTLPQQTDGSAQRLFQEATRLGLTITGPIHWIYTGVNGDETNEFQLEVALPISQPGDPSDAFIYRSFRSFRCACHSYTGSWSDSGPVYDALFAQLYRDGYQNDGHIREVYAVVDLENPSNCVTEIQIGLV